MADKGHDTRESYEGQPTEQLFVPLWGIGVSPSYYRFPGDIEISVRQLPEEQQHHLRSAAGDLLTFARWHIARQVITIEPSGSFKCIRGPSQLSPEQARFVTKSDSIAFKLVTDSFKKKRDLSALTRPEWEKNH